MSGERKEGEWRFEGESKRKGGTTNTPPTFLCPASQQTPPLSGQQVVSEGVQPVETGDAKQPVRDKRRRTRYAQHPSTHSTLGGSVEEFDTLGSHILDKTAEYTLLHFKQCSPHC